MRGDFWEIWASWETGRGGEGGGYWSVDYLCMYTKTYEGKRYWLEPEEGVSGGKEESRT